ncbi:intraflagellar transport protein 52 homolog [Neocloeon triangulifer]|uniref:intraflagellar transport protein 52 homolog n=1 Tax=Neocloeon triangulifer TaxID=2078957 RepID=UPI00286F340C|nr:intraflagellar transport protein 52 homolog [Neocloeon triangulifer]
MTSIIFNETKSEHFRLSDQYRNLHGQLSTILPVEINKDEISAESLKSARVFVLGAPREKFNQSELDCLKTYVDNGGSILVMLGDGGENQYATNINFLLEEYGIMINNDCVIRTHYYKYFHPKECHLPNALTNQILIDALPKHSNNKLNRALTLVYPYGATLNVAKPAVPILSSGHLCFPSCRPICALYHKSAGKIAVIGSGHMLSDTYLDKEDNRQFKDIIFTFLCTNIIDISYMDADDIEISDYHMVPDTAQLAENLKVSLNAPQDIPVSYMDLFDFTLTSINTNHFLNAKRSYELLGIKYDLLKLIMPEFETPLPTLQPSVFPPTFRELSVPPLELYDLDEAFSSEAARVAQIANKCGDADLSYFISSAYEVLGMNNMSEKSTKEMLYSIALQIATFKKQGQAPMDIF